MFAVGQLDGVLFEVLWGLGRQCTAQSCLQAAAMWREIYMHKCVWVVL